MSSSCKVTKNQQKINTNSIQIWSGNKKATKFTKKTSWEGRGLHLGGICAGLGGPLGTIGCFLAVFFWGGVPNHHFFNYRAKIKSKKPFGSILEGSGKVLEGFWECLERILEGFGTL